MECRILGPAEVFAGDPLAPLPLGGVRHRKVLVRLALDANRLIPLPVLIDAVWGDDPPPSAPHVVRNVVSDLRTRWARAGLAEPDRVIVTTGSGYLLRIAADQLDTGRFDALVERARSRAGAGDPAGACGDLRTALGLWRGPTFGDLSGATFAAAAAQWDERRIVAWERCIALELALGRHREVVGELRAQVARHPYREALVAHLMLALHRSGRRAESFAAYRDLRERLADDLGVDPDAGVQRLHAALLRGHPLPPTAPASAAPAR